MQTQQTANLTVAQTVLGFLGDERDGWWYVDQLRQRGLEITATDYDGTVMLRDICEHYRADCLYVYDDDTCIWTFSDGSKLLEIFSVYDVQVIG